MKDRPNVVVLCVDALRADSLEGGEAGASSFWEDAGGRPVLPALEALAAGALRFPNAYACSSWTKPSVPSMLLSLYPTEHGVVEVFRTPEGGAGSPSLPDETPTLAERFSAHGYRTLAVAPNAQLDGSLGFARGFDEYRSDIRWGEAFAGFVRELGVFSRRKPVFAYLHFLESHWPYSLRVIQRGEEEFTGRYPFHRYSASQWKQFKKKLKSGEIEPTDDERRFMRRVYRFAVEDADRAVGRFLSLLSDEGQLERSVVALTADHGEEFLDHGLVGHGQSLYEELLRVPLLLQLPGKAAGRRDQRLASHLDLGATLLDAAGLPAGRDLAGESLLREGAVRRSVFAEVKHKRRYLQAVRHGRHKLVRNFRFARDPGGEDAGDYNNLDELLCDRPHEVHDELYDLASDPAERSDVAALEPETKRALLHELDDWWCGLRRLATGGRRDLSIEVIRQLKALGYL